jgi:NitT/TauT family transport system ATP-binding protein
MVEIEFCQVSKKFSSNRQEQYILDGIDLKIQSGEIVALRGDNGCGKTTLINMVAGIESLTHGKIEFRGLNSESLRIGYIQQDYTSSLLPWFNVLDNIALPLRLRGVKPPEARERVNNLLGELNFNLSTKKYPHQLSGGQRQRIAVARALIHQPHLLLLDEPFSNIDARSSRELQETLLRIHESYGMTALFISHELDHCVYLADRVVLLRGSPSKIYNQFPIKLMRPRNREMILGTAYAELRSQILEKEEFLYAEK